MAVISTGEMLEREREALFGKDANPAAVGLALSGGGIRSATFGLGFIQGLSKLRLLTAFDYLSTVSGGGYIGCWLSAWIHRHPNGVAGVMEELAGPHGSSDGATSPDPEPVRHLRRFSNYLSPRVGVLSADTWALVAIFLRNLLINWLTLVPYIALVLLVPIFEVDLLYALASEPHGFWGKLQPTIYDRDLVRWLGLVCLAAVAFSCAMLSANLPGSRIASLTKAAPALSKKVGEGMSERGFIVAVLIPLTLAAIGLVSYWFLVMTAQEGSLPVPSWRLLVGVGVAVHLLGFGIYSALVLRSRGTETPLRLARDQKMLVLDLAAVVVSGAFAGWLVWILGTSTLPLFATALGSLTSLDLVYAYDASFAVIALPMLLGAFLLAMTVYVAIASRCRSDDDREWYARAGSWVLAVGVGWLCLSALAEFGPLLIKTTTRVTVTAAINLVSGALTWWLGRSAATSGSPAQRQRSAGKSEAGLAVASGVFVVAFTLLLAFGLTELRDFLARAFQWQPATATLVIAAGLAGEILLMMTVNTNVFSLHAMYRDRLIRAYLGASRNGRRENRFTHFDPYDNLPLAYLAAPFLSVSDWPEVHAIASRLQAAGERTEVDEVDPDLIATTVRVSATDRPAIERVIERWNDLLSRLGNPAKFRGRWNAMVQPAYSGVPAGVHGSTAELASNAASFPWPFDPSGERRNRPPLHILNTALNLVSGEDLDWQERKAALFTMTPLHAGSPVTKYRPMHDEEGRFYGGTTGVSLGTAMAISGAAANPSMGFHSSPLVTFLLTLLNGRLGAWIGNPHDDDTFSHGYPRGFRMIPMPLLEAFGQTTSRGKYVNLSDGGHLENLGLYELVRRRCRYIVAIDAGADEDYTFEDLGNAVRKIRVDLGVDIDIKGFRIKEPPTKYIARGTIKYPDCAPGTLLYVKPVPCDGDEPVDVKQYGKAHQSYPQESTVDQWFSESQFESYRALGEYIAVTIGCGGTDRDRVTIPTDVEDFFRRADDYVQKTV
jgi:hypothetical protein